MAYLPDPFTVRLGGELYSYPGLVTRTCSIFPLLTIGRSSASLPLNNLKLGCLLKLIISLAPYPTPLSVKSTDSIEPRKMGWSFALKSCPLKVVTPIFPETTTDISG